MSYLNSFLSFSIGPLTVWAILATVLLILVGVLLSKVVLRIIRKALARSTLDASFQNVLLILSRVILYTLVVLIVADHLGIPVTSLVAVLSIVGLAVSLAIQDTLTNVFGGILLLMSKTFVAGDYVQVAGLEGSVVKVDLMNTYLRTVDNKTVRIPNKDVQTAAIINFSHEPIRRVEIRVTTSYDDETETVKAALLRTAANTETVLRDPAPFAGLFAYQSSQIEYVLQVWTATENYWKTYYALNEGVREAFKEDGITMTYEHLYVHTIPEKGGNDQ